MATANQADFLGEGTNTQPGVSRTPEEIEASRRRAASNTLTADARRTATTNVPYMKERGEAHDNLTRLNNEIATTSAGRAGIELPFAGDIPGIGNTLEGAFSAAQRGPLNAADYIKENPGVSALTLGAAPAIAGADAAVDDLATGITRDITGNERGSVNVPLTPGQIYDPNGSLYDAGAGGPGNIDIPGLKDVGEAIGEGIGDLFGGGGGGPGGGGPGSGYGAETSKAAIEDLAGEQDFTRDLGLDVLSGNAGGVDPAGRNLQLSELDRIRGFLSGDRAQQGVMSDVDAFLGAPQGPSAAELQLQGAQDDAMSDALSLARSARGGAGATNRALRTAMAENAATQATGSRDMALLRAKEEEARRDQTLRGLGLQGQLAGGLDRDTLQALGLGGDMASNIAGLGVQERGQTLGAATDLIGGALDSSTGLAQTAIPAYLQNDLGWAELGNELTPQQKMQLGALGAGGDLLTALF